MSDSISAVELSASAPTLTIGIDVGDRDSHACVVDASRRVLEEFCFPTDRGGLARKLDRPSCQVILEVGPHSRWMQKSLERLGHTVRVVDARKIQLISKSNHKTDKRDARTLAQLGAGVPELLGSIRHRSDQAQADLTVLLTRDHFIQLRTATINRVRGVLKSAGVKVPKMSTKTFHLRVGVLVPELLQPGILPLLEGLKWLRQQLRTLDKQVQSIAARYPVVEKLLAVQGVGALTALAFVLALDDPSRFKKSRDVGPFVGLTPRKRASGEKDPQLSITRTGNPYLRRILVQAAHYILGPGPDCLLRRHGMRIHAAGGKHAKKRAAVAVARKLAVLLHRLWVSETPYDRWHRCKAPPSPEVLQIKSRRSKKKPRSSAAVS
jgi:transposase